MPIPFHDAGDVEELGSAGFLKLESLVGDDRLSLGAAAGLLVINARGEPLEFAFNRLELRSPGLWGPGRARGALQRRLVASLLSVCSHDPRLLVCLDDEIDVHLFGRELRLEVPVARVQASPPMLVTWQRSPPADGSAELRLFERLGARGLVLEPFERAALGLREVFSDAMLPASVSHPPERDSA